MIVETVSQSRSRASRQGSPSHLPSLLSPTTDTWRQLGGPTQTFTLLLPPAWAVDQVRDLLVSFRPGHHAPSDVMAALWESLLMHVIMGRCTPLGDDGKAQHDTEDHHESLGCRCAVLDSCCSMLCAVQYVAFTSTH